MKKQEGCNLFGNICHYACCNQGDESSYYIWMYPGEYESAIKSKKHIEIIGEENGAMLGRCKCTEEEKKKCDGKKWFKPLDCWSYPFFPFIENGNLVLKVDSIRCPMVGRYSLDEQYIQIYNMWKKIISNEKVYHCIEALKMDNYKEFHIKDID